MPSNRRGPGAAVAPSLLFLAGALVLAGCSLGYTNLHPGENSGLYAELFSDIITNYDAPHWLWVRGSIEGDLDGNGVVDEELVIATIQQGTPRSPGPIEMAFLVACSVSAEGRRTAMARTLLFDSSPIPGSPKPVNDLGLVSNQPFTRTRAQMVQDKVTLNESVIVYFWGDTMPGSVWYAGYDLKDGKLEKNFESTFWQSAPGFIQANLDRSIDASPFGYQLLFGVAAIPDSIVRKLGNASDMPLWGHVYARDTEGDYHQSDIRFGEHYRQLENSWNQIYLKAVIRELPDEELAWFEYHMGIMNHYTGNGDMSERFLDKAKRNADDPALLKAIDDAAGFIAARRGAGAAADD